MPILHRVTSAFEEHDPFLHATLGAVALLRRLRPTCRRLVRDDVKGDARAADPAEGEVDAGLLYAALGLIALSQNGFGQLSSIRTPRIGAPSARGTRTRASSRRLRPRELLA